MKLSHIHPRRSFVATVLVMGFLSGCATPLPQPITGFTCCNLRPASGWFSSNTYLGGPILAAGQPVLIDSVQRGRYFYGTVGDDYLSMRYDSARNKDDALDWAHQIVVPTDPKVQFASWSPEVQAAVNSAKVLVGMTRPQVLMSLSYPSRDDTKDLTANAWRYWTAPDDEVVEVNFGADNTVSGFTGKPLAVRRVEFKR